MSNELTGDLGKAFERLKDEWFYTYRGVTFNKVDGGWERAGFVCRNREEMDSLIDQWEKQLADSINRK